MIINMHMLDIYKHLNINIRFSSFDVCVLRQITCLRKFHLDTSCVSTSILTADMFERSYMHIFWENVAIVCVIDRFCRLTNGIRCLFLNKHSTKCPKKYEW